MTAETFIQFLVDRKLRSFFSYSFLISNAFLEEGGAFIFAKSGRNGGIAQLVEHLPCKQGVIGSNPITSTIWAHSSAG